MVFVGDRADGGVHLDVHGHDLLPDRPGELDRLRLVAVDDAFGRVPVAEPGPGRNRPVRRLRARPVEAGKVARPLRFPGLAVKAARPMAMAMSMKRDLRPIGSVRCPEAPWPSPSWGRLNGFGTMSELVPRGRHSVSVNKPL